MEEEKEEQGGRVVMGVGGSEGVPCPMKTLAGDRYGWRSGGWICRRRAGSRARGQVPAVRQMSSRDWLACSKSTRSQAGSASGRRVLGET